MTSNRNIQIKRGDIFFVQQTSRVGNFINWAQRLLSKDNASKYTHSGIFLNKDGLTLEALWTISSHNFWERYKGKEVLIARPKVPLGVRYYAVDKIALEDSGKWYPVHRFLYLALPQLVAKYIDTGHSVCSEWTAKFVYYCGVRHAYFQGTTPDTLADEVLHWRDEYEILLEGKAE